MVNKFLSVFVSVLALSHAMPGDIQSYPLLNGDYDSLISFIDSFMTGYTGQAYDLPADCLSTAQQGQINQDIVALFFSTLQFKKEAIAENFETLIDDLAKSTYGCGFESIVDNLSQDIKTKSKYWILANIVLNEENIMTNAHKSFVDLQKKDWSAAGQYLGMAMAFVVPSPTVNLRTAPTDIIDLAEGFVSGLEGNTQTPGNCMIAVDTTGSALYQILTDAKKVLSGNYAVVNQLMKELKSIIPTAASVNSECDWATLESKIDAFLKLGPKAALSKYFINRSTIDSDVQKVKDCTADFAGCGQAAGEIVRIMLGWSLNSSLIGTDSGRPNYNNFFDGIVVGLQNNPAVKSNCFLDLQDVITYLQYVITDTNNIVSGRVIGYAAILSDTARLVENWDYSKKDCDFSSLSNIFANVFTYNGLNDLIDNYLDNGVATKASFDSILQCGDNYTTCGESVGTLFRVLSGWSI